MVKKFIECAADEISNGGILIKANTLRSKTFMTILSLFFKSLHELLINHRNILLFVFHILKRNNIDFLNEIYLSRFNFLLTLIPKYEKFMSSVFRHFRHISKRSLIKQIL